MMSSVQNKKICIGLTLSSDYQDETMDSVIKHKTELPKLPREIWLRIWSFNFGEDPEQYTNIKKNRLEMKKCRKFIILMRKSITVLENVIKDDMDKIRSIELEFIELDEKNKTQNKTNMVNEMKKSIRIYDKYIYDEKKEISRLEDNIMEFKVKIRNLIGLLYCVK